jgi:uncharacterized sulfatase
LQFIEENRQRPFFLYLAHAMPHKPLACSEAYYQHSGSGLYGDVISELDWSVGQVLAKLKESGLDENTLVFFTSDNGPWYGGSTGGLRGMKGSTCEGGTRVPLIARWPGTIPAGQVSREPAIMMDLFVTSLRAAGIAPPADRKIDGRDIMPLLRGETDSSREALFGFQGAQLCTVRSGRWKLHVIAPNPGQLVAMTDDAKWRDPLAPDGVRLLAPYEQYRPSQHPGLQGGDPIPAMALFDLEADPGEQHNVAAQHSEVVARLKKLFDEFLAETKVRERLEKQETGK